MQRCHTTRLTISQNREAINLKGGGHQKGATERTLLNQYDPKSFFVPLEKALCVSCALYCLTVGEYNTTTNNV